MKSLLITCLWILAALTGLAQSPEWMGYRFQKPGGGTVELSQIGKQRGAVIFFLSPECPLCENYSLTINQLKEQFKGSGIEFYGVFSGKYYPENQIVSYLAKYRPPVVPLLDPGYRLRAALEAQVTPEAFLVSPQGKVVYRGAIDNWAVSLGKKRTVVTAHYLRDAIQAFLDRREPELARTDAVGCFIQ
jgi:thiol-disulfide isomerase/thioredoxin